MVPLQDGVGDGCDAWKRKYFPPFRSPNPARSLQLSRAAPAGSRISSLLIHSGTGRRISAQARSGPLPDADVLYAVV